jgi:hypothetical protein
LNEQIAGELEHLGYGDVAVNVSVLEESRQPSTGRSPIGYDTLMSYSTTSKESASAEKQHGSAELTVSFTLGIKPTTPGSDNQRKRFGRAGM